MKEILPGFKIIDAKPGLFVEKIKALVISDLHIGYEAALEKQGIQIPKSQYPKIKKQIKEMLEMVDAQKIIINGDLKHEFGEATLQEWKETKDLLEFLKSRKLEIIVVRGNHDNFIIPLLKKMDIGFYDPYYFEKGILFMHGHKEISLKEFGKEVKEIIIANEHPSVVIRDELGIKHKFKCFLKGKAYGKPIIVIPALSPLAEGYAINVAQEFLSPILKSVDIKEMVAYIIEPEAEVLEIPLKNLVF